jgi:hypothetical protein
MGVWYFGENVKSIGNGSKTHLYLCLFSNVRKHKTDMTWVFGILEKMLSQSEMTAKLIFISVF